MDKAQLNTFMNQPKIQKMIPEGWDDSKKRCICFPNIPVNHARHPYTNRLVIIGDAGISRTYKNGIDSAFTTAQLAAKTAFERGVSEKILKKDILNLRKDCLAETTFTVA